jgi:hypothetical protein
MTMRTRLIISVHIGHAVLSRRAPPNLRRLITLLISISIILLTTEQFSA